MNSVEAKKGFVSFIAFGLLFSAIAFTGNKVLYALRNKAEKVTPDIALVEPVLAPITESPTPLVSPTSEPVGTIVDINGDGIINSLDVIPPKPQ